MTFFNNKMYIHTCTFTETPSEIVLSVLHFQRAIAAQTTSGSEQSLKPILLGQSI